MRLGYARLQNVSYARFLNLEFILAVKEIVKSQKGNQWISLDTDLETAPQLLCGTDPVGLTRT